MVVGSFFVVMFFVNILYSLIITPFINRTVILEYLVRVRVNFSL